MYLRGMSPRRHPQMYGILAVGVSLVALGACISTVYLASTGRLACIGEGSNGSYSTQQEARKLAILSLVTAFPGMILSGYLIADRRRTRSARFALALLVALLVGVCVWALFVLYPWEHFCT